MTDLSIVVQTLRELGITRTEAEVYLATLQEANGGAVSGYRVAQSVGKDPANLSKTLASLEKLGAVRTIQEKPRLYIPVPPNEFTDKLLADMKSNQARILDQLSHLEFHSPLGIPMALNDQEQTIHKAAQLLTRCRRELLIFASRNVLESLGTSLEVLAASSDVSVKLLCIENLNLPGFEETIIPLPIGFSDPEPVPWLQMIIDRQIWLTASFPSNGADKSPCGWWSDDPSMALIMGAGLSAALENTIEVSIEIPEITVIDPEPEPEFHAEELVVENEPVFEAGSIVQPGPATPEKPELLTEKDSEEDDGIQFIIRHDEDENDEEK